MGGTVALPIEMPRAREADAAALFDQLSNIVGERITFTREQARLLVVGDQLSGFVDTESGLFDIHRADPSAQISIGSPQVNLAAPDLPAEDALSTSALVFADADAMITIARKLTRELGANDEETAGAHIKELAASDFSSGEVIHKLGKKVFIFRKVAGLDVESNRSVLTFDTSDRFRSFRGKWQTYTNSGADLRGFSTTSKEQLADRAVGEAKRRFPNEKTFAKLNVHLSFLFEDDEQPSALALKGMSVVPRESRDIASTAVILPFDL